MRQLGSKVQKMEKLSPTDILVEVHEAAEELQMRIDQKSYLLVNTESWEKERRPKELEDSKRTMEIKENDTRQRVITSLSETVVDVSIPAAQGWDSRNPNMPEWNFSEEMLRKQISWPSRLSLNDDTVLNEKEVKTYESASALSLATFASLLIEFVARLQNLVDSFEELSEKANFKEPMMDSVG